MRAVFIGSISVLRLDAAVEYLAGDGVDNIIILVLMSVKLDLIPRRVTGLFKFNVVRVNHGDGGTGVVKRNVQRCFRTDI